MYTNMTTNLMVEDVDASVSFYQSILGFTLVDSVSAQNGGLQFAIVSRDGLTLMFQSRENLIEEYPNLDTQAVTPSCTLYIIVDEFDECYRILREKHVIIADVHETFYGAKEFAIMDNTGYVLTFTERKNI